MKYLLPHSFKKIGIILSPIGLIVWSVLQLNGIQFGLSNHSIEIALLIISFFSFLGGIYFITFSKEKIEDEMIQKIRLDSLLFAALVQLLFLLAGFLLLLFVHEPKDAGLMTFFILLLFLFWTSFIVRFNYIIHFKSGSSHD